ncbi:MAG TPA: DoxX family protein [Cyclobacteriaceae bacterium]|nr:DoxX family protein [Cyclobacteriaceae bacterium]HNU40984.1 DoxX family protein [Cyclobacteriaceae bacterium]
MKKLFVSDPIYPEKALAVVRIVVGLLLIYHGLEVFDRDTMQSYLTWDTFKGGAGEFLVYLGKSSEFISGILITVGFFTRLGGLIAAGTMCYITFFVGSGRFWYEDQHPFMFVLFAVLFFFTGPGAWSLDQWLAQANKRTRQK